MPRLARREPALAAHLPYAAHVARHVVVTHGGDLLTAFRLDGRAAETREPAELADWHARLNGLWRNLASPELAVWSHLVRERIEPPPLAPVEGWAETLTAHYRERLATRRLYRNALYLTFVRRAHAVPAERLVRAWRRDAPASAAVSAEALDAVEALATQVTAALAAYGVERLGVGDDRRHSTLLELLGLLVNGERARWPLPFASIDAVLPTVRPLFGVEAVERRAAGWTQLGAALAWKEYPPQTTPGLLDGLAALDAELVLTQSFAWLPKSTAQGLIQRQLARLANARDAAVSQREQLADALDRLVSNEFVLGGHHLSLFVWGERVAGAVGAAELEAVESALGAARTLLADAGAVVAREDLGLEAAYYAQLPGNFGYRARSAPITSRNFAALAPLHGQAYGRPDGHHWGEALWLLTSRAATPVWFALHGADGEGARDIGHTLICGPTGSGKTVFLGACLARLAGLGVTQVAFDKDRGLAPLIRTLGGEYRTLAVGQPTGLNPLQLPDGPAHREFLGTWLRGLVGGVATREASELDAALAGTLSLPRADRRLARLMEFLDPTDLGGLRARLAPWAEGGERAWAFDAEPSDRVAPLLDGTLGLVAFDVTEFLDRADVRGPLTAYLFHLVRGLLDGRRLVVWMDEFAKLLADPAFEAFAKDGLKTWRKLNAVAAFATQSAADILGSPIARTLVEQTPTRVLFPNPALDPEEYARAFGLNAREIEWLKRGLAPGARQCLIRQGAASVLAALDFAGMEEEIRVLSGRAG